MTRIFTLNITADTAGKTIKTILKFHYNMSTNLIKKLKTSGGIQVNKSEKHVDYVLEPGDELTLTIYDGKSENIIPINMDLDIIYEDEDILIINKPPKLPTHPSLGHYSDTLANGLMAKYNGDFVFRAVNRLDKDTSGLMVLAKNPYSHDILNRQLHTNSFKRRYCAVVHGNVTHSGTVELPIGRCPDSIIKRCIDSNGQYAKTHYSVIEHCQNASILRLALDTGRTHQIRVHLSAISHPIIGDWLYGTESIYIDRQALHSMELEFAHPVSKQHMSFYAPIPDDMKKCYNIMKRNKNPS